MNLNPSQTQTWRTWRTWRTWIWQAPFIALAAWALWHAVQWGVVNAEFKPDLLACQALERQGACWGVVAAKGQAWFMGARSSTGQVTGLPLTLWLTALTLLGSVPIAVVLAWGRLSKVRVLSWASTAIIETVRGAPLIMWLFAAAFVLPAITTPLVNALGKPDWEPSMVTRVAIVLTLFSAAYMAEVLRGSLRVVAKEQAEAAAVLGASWWTTQWRIVLPQAFRGAIPALTGHTIGMLKDTSLVTVVSLQDLTGAMSMGNPPRNPAQSKVEFSMKESSANEEVKVQRQPDHGCAQAC